MSEVVESAGDTGLRPRVVGPESYHLGGEHVVARLPLRELLRPGLELVEGYIVERDDAPGTVLRLREADLDSRAVEVHLAPCERAQFAVAQAGVQREDYCDRQRT
jgi:hypothetical protein